MERLYSSRWFHLLAASVITVSILIAYSNTFHAAFQFDDIPQVVENGALKSISNIPSVLKFNRPVTLITFILNYAWGGDEVFGYHAVNTAIHILASVFAYFLLYNIFRTAGASSGWSKRIAAFSALLFALHPVQTQAVTYIVQRMESLASLFYILSVLFFVLAVNAPAPVRRLVLYSATVLAYALGFYSKEVAITVPAVIFIVDLFFVSKSGLRGLAPRLPLYAVLVVMLGYFAFSTIKPLGSFGDLSRESSPAAGALNQAGEAKEVRPGARRNVQPVFEGPSAGFSQTAITPKEYLFTQFNVMVYYIALLAVPVNQNLDYDFPVAKNLFTAPRLNSGTVLNLPVVPPVVSLAILLSILALAVYLFVRKGRSGVGLIVSFFIFWFFIILSPTSSFVPIIDVIYEHRLYLASLGFFVIFVIFVDMLASKLLSRG